MKTLLVVLAVLLPVSAAAETLVSSTVNLPDGQVGALFGTMSESGHMGGFVDSRGSVGALLRVTRPVTLYFGFRGVLNDPARLGFGVLTETPPGITFRWGVETNPTRISSGVGCWF